MRQVLQAAALFVALLLVWTAAMLYMPSADRVTVQLNEPSPRNILAPRRLVYVSEIKTEEARNAAASQVPDTYTGVDATIADAQVLRLQGAIEQITEIRQDALLSLTDKRAQVLALADFRFDDTQISLLLDADADAWQTISAEALRLLELVMHDDIREGQAATKAQQGYLLVRRDLSASQRDLIVRLVAPYVVPNNFLDVEQTAANRQNARRQVEPVQWTIRAGESILREGEIATPLAIEKLQALGLLNDPPRWEDFLGDFALVLSMVATLAAYVFRTQPLLVTRPRRLLLLVLTLMVAGVSARFMIPGHVLTPYIFPAAAFAMLIAALLNLDLAILASALLSVIVGMNAGGSLDLVVYALVSSVAGSIAVSHIDQLVTFMRAAGYVALACAAVVLSFDLINGLHDTLGLVQLVLAALSNGILSASLSFVAFLAIGRVFGITTFVQLMELARPTHPLFRRLLIEAPGTYHHSIVVSNMAERAAQAIGADPLLVRVGAYYHDIGKLARPYFFAENQSDGNNPHDTLDPQESAEIIIAHTADGRELCLRNGLPDRVCDFATEHHGTSRASYFYHQASQTNGEPVDDARYRYPGPKPQSKETAIVMLADSIEATVRARRPTTQEDTAALVHRIIMDRLVNGQLSDADLTMRDLDRVETAFMGILRGIFHPRIDYPEGSREPQAVVQAETAQGPADAGAGTP